eukprot:362548-Chlamydomonas_euryale.AAC.11
MQPFAMHPPLLISANFLAASFFSASVPVTLSCVHRGDRRHRMQTARVSLHDLRVRSRSAKGSSAANGLPDGTEEPISCMIVETAVHVSTVQHFARLATKCAARLNSFLTRYS